MTMTPSEGAPQLEPVHDRIPAAVTAVDVTRTWATLADRQQPEAGGVHRATVEGMLA